MKNNSIFLLIITLYPLLSCSCTYENDEDFVMSNNLEEAKIVNPSLDLYMKLTPSGLHPQGAACYENYYVQGFAGNGIIDIYDLKKKERIAEIKNPYPGLNVHANSLCFGKEKYKPEDYFPILYISSGYVSIIDGFSCSFIYAYRLIRSELTNGNEAFSMEFINKIILKGMGSWTEGIIDNENDILWIKYEPNGTRGEYRYASFPVPSIEKGETTLTPEDAITDFSVGVQPFVSSNQGHLFYKDKILLVSGTSPSVQLLAFIAINTKTFSRELVVDLHDLGLREEPESITIYNGQLLVGGVSNIYKANFYSIE